ncbi:MAG: alpha/beta hydrolase, partial [Acidobacteriota bacterium]|nr:alpha/beta hydrolase [Acidobacteriota bacterium]
SAYIALFRAPGHVAEQQLLTDNASKLRAAYQGKVPADRVAENVRRFSEPNALTAALNWYRALDLNARTGKVDVPTLFIWGAEDVALGETAATNTVDHVTGPYRFEALPEKSHWLLEEVPDRIASLILGQLAATASR